MTRELLQRALFVLESVNVMCCDFHHGKGDRHDQSDECQPHHRYQELIADLYSELESWKSGEATR